ncbi:hypothetical protein ABZX51_010298 [Aspergillus tubingensis]
MDSLVLLLVGAVDPDGDSPPHTNWYHTHHTSIHTYIPLAPILIQILCLSLLRFSPASFPLLFHLTVRPLFDARSFLLYTLIPWVFCSILLCSTHSLDSSVDQSINPSKRKQ